MAAMACSHPTSPTGAAEFIVDVVGERFVMRTTDAETIRLATENLQGQNRRFPSGPLRAGSGGFNGPWTWHLDPDATRMVEAAIEVCDGTPSYVESHKADFPTYCPWSARVVGRK
jgi:hypothetical protein